MLICGFGFWTLLIGCPTSRVFASLLESRGFESSPNHYAAGFVEYSMLMEPYRWRLAGLLFCLAVLIVYFFDGANFRKQTANNLYSSEQVEFGPFCRVRTFSRSHSLSQRQLFQSTPSRVPLGQLEFPTGSNSDE